MADFSGVQAHHVLHISTDSTSASFPLRGRPSPAALALLLGRIFSGQLKDQQAEEVYRLALQDFASTSNDWDTTATLLREYVRLVTQRGKVWEAKATYDYVIRSFVHKLGRAHETTLLSIYETGNALWTSGAFSEAERVYEEAIFDLDFSRCKDNILLLHIMEKLGTVYIQQARWREAEDMHHAALKGFLKVYQNYFHLKVVSVVLNLGNALRVQGKLKDAAQMVQWGSSGLQQAFGLEHAETIHAFDQLALIHRATKKFKDAEHALDSALSGCQGLYGQHHEQTLRRRAEFVVILRDHGKFREAQTACELLLGECETFENDWKFVVRNYLGTIHAKAGQFGKAEEEFAAALVGFRKYGGQQSPLALIVLYNMATASHARGRLDLAELACRQALTGLRQAVGHNHIATRAAAEMLGLLLMAQGRIAEAANACSETLNLCKAEASQPMTEIRRATAANFEAMTTSCLPSYSQSSRLCVHDTRDSFMAQANNNGVLMK